MKYLTSAFTQFTGSVETITMIHTIDSVSIGRIIDFSIMGDNFQNSYSVKYSVPKGGGYMSVRMHDRRQVKDWRRWNDSSRGG